MSDTKFTQGPWKLYKGKEHNIVQRGESGGFGVVDTDKIRMDADSNLIAAAPDLYEALELVFSQMDDWDVGYGEALAALAKARGEK